MSRKTLADLFEEAATANAAEWDRLNTPEKIAERAARQERERLRRVELGWEDEDGNPIKPDADPEDEDDDDEDGEASR
jgi:hypothetical protein